MPVSILAQTQTGYIDALKIGPSQQIREIQFSISAPYSAKFQLAKLNKSGIPAWDESDTPAQPGNGGYSGCYGIRFKSFDPLNPTTVFATAFFFDDPSPQGFLAGSSVFGTNGQTSPGVLSVITGIVFSTGVVLAGTGFSVVRSAVGTYQITFTPPSPFTATPVVNATLLDGATLLTPDVQIRSAAGVTIVFSNTTTGVPADTAFNFVATAIQ